MLSWYTKGRRPIHDSRCRLTSPVYPYAHIHLTLTSTYRWMRWTARHSEPRYHHPVSSTLRYPGHSAVQCWVFLAGREHHHLYQGWQLSVYSRSSSFLQRKWVLYLFTVHVGSFVPLVIGSFLNRYFVEIEKCEGTKWWNNHDNQLIRVVLRFASRHPASKDGRSLSGDLWYRCVSELFRGQRTEGRQGDHV